MALGTAVVTLSGSGAILALQGSGTVEARDIRVGSKVGGRIDKVLVREGDRVESGQTSRSPSGSIQELLAISGPRSDLRKAKRGFRPEEIAEARAAAAQAKADYELRVNGYRQVRDIAAAQSRCGSPRRRGGFARASTSSVAEAQAQKDLPSQ